MPRARLIVVLRDLSPEQVLESINSPSISPHQGLKLSDEQKRPASESVAGRLLGTAEDGDAKLMPNRCSSNPPLVNPASMPAWNGWGADDGNNSLSVRQSRRTDRCSSAAWHPPAPLLQVECCLSPPGTAWAAGVTRWGTCCSPSRPNRTRIPSLGRSTNTSLCR
jgi:hypothetical protein